VSITGTTTRPARVSGVVRAGRGTLRLRAPRRPGRYRITLSVDASDGQQASDTARLVVTRRRRSLERHATRQ